MQRLLLAGVSVAVMMAVGIGASQAADKKALAFVQLNQLGQGIEQLRFVTSNYPGTDEARIASDRLQSLGKP